MHGPASVHTKGLAGKRGRGGWRTPMDQPSSRAFINAFASYKLD